MGGVDSGDQLRGYHRCQIKSRKFLKYIFFLFDVAITNSLHKHNEQKSQEHKALSSEPIANYSYSKPPGRVSRSIQLLPMLHFPRRIPDEEKAIAKRGRYTHCMKTKKKRTDTTWYCNECEVWLCHTGIADTDCFLTWHRTNNRLLVQIFFITHTCIVHVHCKYSS